MDVQGPSVAFGDIRCCVALLVALRCILVARQRLRCITAALRCIIAALPGNRLPASARHSFATALRARARVLAQVVLDLPHQPFEVVGSASSSIRWDPHGACACMACSRCADRRVRACVRACLCVSVTCMRACMHAHVHTKHESCLTCRLGGWPRVPPVHGAPSASAGAAQCGSGAHAVSVCAV
jgi:hypothetical protein